MKYREIPPNEMLLEIEYATGFCVDLRCVNIQISSSGLMLVNEDGKSEVSLETNCHKMHFMQSIARISTDEMAQINQSIIGLKGNGNQQVDKLICDKSSLIIRSTVHNIDFDALSTDDAGVRRTIKKLLFVVKSILVVRNCLSELLDKRLSALKEA